ncbi:MAG: CDP-diacylglycerol--serine O-phosphatidyltransferase [Desulfobulbaceae bacterium]|nr:CDP-diacylglycerol--serine O-phosphatidyltransferase [Desulfobulbaceae bacterium]
MESTPTNSKIYILPCMLTCTSLFCGFYSIVAAINGDFFNSAVAILVAGVFDGLDGRVARMTGATSKFGFELDSLCDLVSFGVAPALLVYQWALLPFERYGWLAAFLYVATTALRLARFNTHISEDHDFIGLPCPAAAGLIATTVMFFTKFFEINGPVEHITLLFLVYILSYLMVSNHPYRSFKQPDTMKKAKSFQAVVGMILLLALLATEPPITLFAFTLLYVSSGPILALYGLVVKDRKKISDKKTVS